MSPSTRTTTVRELAVIRLALLAGVLMFGALNWFLVRQRGGPPAGADAGSFAFFRVLVPALCVAAIGVAVALRPRVARARDDAQRVSLRMVAWAVGEGCALAGAVHYFLTGDPRLYVLGVVALLATFIIVPLRQPA
jgi:hypothetical protein